MKVYLVMRYYNNGESYEDHYDSFEHLAVCESKEIAWNYILKEVEKDLKEEPVDAGFSNKDKWKIVVKNEENNMCSLSRVQYWSTEEVVYSICEEEVLKKEG